MEPGATAAVESASQAGEMRTEDVQQEEVHPNADHVMQEHLAEFMRFRALTDNVEAQMKAALAREAELKERLAAAEARAAKAERQHRPPAAASGGARQPSWHQEADENISPKRQKREEGSATSDVSVDEAAAKAETPRQQHVSGKVEGITLDEFLEGLTARFEAQNRKISELEDAVKNRTWNEDSVVLRTITACVEAAEKERTNATVEAIRAEFQALKERCDVQAEAKERTDAKVDAIKAEVQALKGRCDMQAKAKEQADAQVDAIIAEVQALKERCDAQAGAKKRTDATVNAFTAEVQALQKRCDAQAKANERTDATVNATTEEVRALKERTDAQAAANELTDVTVDVITEEFRTLKEDMYRPPMPPGKFWTEFSDNGSFWWYYDGPLGKWWKGAEDERPVPWTF